MQEGKMYESWYTNEIIRRNCKVEPKGESCISFELLGTNSAKINANIPLTDEVRIREINEQPYVKIVQNWDISFDDVEEGSELTDKILIQRTYYKEV